MAGGAVRVGVALGTQWGVELEVAFSGTREWSPLPYALPAAALPPELTIPVFDGQAQRQVQTGSVLGWFRRPMTGRTSLVVLAGLGLNRTSETATYYSPLALVVPPANTVYYDAGPVVGVDVPVRLTDHLDLTGGFRVHVVGDAFTANGWLLRPSAGVRWRF